MSTQPKTFLTPEQYLEIERKAEYKSEYFQGEMFAMAGASEEHVVATANVVTILNTQFRGRGCRVYTSDMRVYIPASGSYTYPDVTAVCGERKFQDARTPDVLLNPVLIVEVLSPSTEAYDRGRKFEQYQSIGSLRQYVLIASDRVHIDLYTRQSENVWTFLSAGRLEDTLDLDSIGCRLPLSDVYNNVDFPQ